MYAITYTLEAALFINDLSSPRSAHRGRVEAVADVGKNIRPGNEVGVRLSRKSRTFAPANRAKVSVYEKIYRGFSHHSLVT